jgi:hypothetical protein
MSKGRPYTNVIYNCELECQIQMSDQMADKNARYKCQINWRVPENTVFLHRIMMGPSLAPPMGHDGPKLGPPHGP